MTTVTSKDVKPILIRSVKIALVVGPLLTLINQWEAILAFKIPDIGKSLLTFLVPFCVSFFSGYKMRKTLAAQMCETATLIDELRAEARDSLKRAERAENALHSIQAEDQKVPRRTA